MMRSFSLRTRCATASSLGSAAAADDDAAVEDAPVLRDRPPPDRAPDARLPPRAELAVDLLVVPDRDELDPDLEPPRLGCGINHSFRPS
jgi:hypothetical protein